MMLSGFTIGAGINIGNVPETSPQYPITPKLAHKGILVQTIHLPPFSRPIIIRLMLLTKACSMA